jgi:hypothetical protein
MKGRMKIMIKNLTQIFIVGILAGTIITGSFIAFITNFLGFHYTWIVLVVGTVGLSTQFYAKLERCK